jgi:hypothetical protein
MTRLLGGTFLFAVSTLGCGSALSGAVDEYEAGRAPQALRELQAVAEGGACTDEHELARYALFRGLTHLTLGDALAAERWLLALKRRLELEPDLLSTSEKSRLVTALGSMGHLPGD